MTAQDRDKIEQLKNAIAALQAQRAVLGDEVVLASITALNQQLQQLQGEGAEPERRLVTVLSMDTVDSTRLGQSLEAEDYLELMDGALQRLAARVEAHGGRVLRFMGDGMLALFGAPASQENDAEQAVRAGLEMLQEARVYAAEISDRLVAVPFQVRVGVNTGMVAIGGVSEAENTVMGLPVNLGVRLESAAPPGGMLISLSTYQQVRGMFDLQPIEPITAKGFPEAVPVFLVKGSLPASFKTVNRGLEGLDTPLVGREADLERLKETLTSVIDTHQPNTLTIVGDPGVGKSRLLAEFERWLLDSDVPVLIFRARSRPEMLKSPYAMLRDLFAEHFSIQENDPGTVVARKLESGIEADYTAETHAGAAFTPEGIRARAHFIGHLLGYDFSHSPYLQGITADARQLRDRAHLYLLDYFLMLSQHSPTLLFMEDLHWADERSLDFLADAQQSWGNHPILVISLARPSLFERRPAWGDAQANHSRLELEPLSSRQSRHLVEEILRPMEGVPLALRELVVQRAEGNPFFIEELIKMLIDQGVILTGESPWIVSPQGLSEVLSSSQVPTSLVGVLQARLDSLLPGEKSVLQQASVVGRVFWDDVLRFMAEESGNATEIDATLAALARKGLIFPRQVSSMAPAQEYIFKHALLRDVVYDSMVRRVRQAHHARAASWLIDLGAAGALEIKAAIAEHLELAGQPEQAAMYFRQAGEQAAQRYANDQALHYLERALQLAPQSDTAERFCSLVARAQVLSLLGARQEQEQDLLELSRLAEEIGDQSWMAESALLQAASASERSDYQGVIAYAREAIRLAQLCAKPRLEAQAYLLWGRALLSQGDYSGARANFEQALSMARAHELQAVEADSLRLQGTAAQRLGETDQAREYFEAALAISRQIGDRRGEGQALNGLGNALLIQGDLENGQRCYAEFLEISREIGDRLGEGLVVHDMGAAHLEQADYQGAVEYFEQALKIGREIGNRTIEGSALVGMGSVHLQRSEYTRAKGNFEESLKIARTIGNRPWEAKTLAELGRLFLHQGDYIQAREHITQALQLYRQLGDRLGESRVLIDQGALFEYLGDSASARRSAEAALAIARDLEHQRYTGLGLILLGSSQAALGEQEQAQQAFRQAITLLEEGGLADQAVEAHAGLADLALAQGNLAEASMQLQAVLKWLTPQEADRAGSRAGPRPNLESVADPLRIYLVAYRVLQAQGDARAANLLEQARLLLSRKAAGLSDTASTDTLLYNIPTHRQILHEIQKTFVNVSPG